VDVHVPEAGNEKFSAAVDDARVARYRCRSGGANLADPVSDDDHRIVGRDRPAHDIHHGRVRNRNRRRPSGPAAASSCQAR